jgi:hypothetical protein
LAYSYPQNAGPCFGAEGALLALLHAVLVEENKKWPRDIFHLWAKSSFHAGS